MTCFIPLGAPEATISLADKIETVPCPICKSKVVRPKGASSVCGPWGHRIPATASIKISINVVGGPEMNAALAKLGTELKAIGTTPRKERSI